MNAENAEAGGKGCGKSFGRAESEEKENAVKRLKHERKRKFGRNTQDRPTVQNKMTWIMFRRLSESGALLAYSMVTEDG